MATVVHAIIGYFFLLLTVRVLTRRPGGQMTLFEFVIVFLVGGVVILATVGKDRSITNCIIAIIAVSLMHTSVSALKSRFPKFGAIVDGTPLVLIENGHWRQEVMKGMRLAPEDVMAAGRVQGLKSIHEIQFAILERNGAISIIKTEEK